MMQCLMRVLHHAQLMQAVLSLARSAAKLQNEGVHK